ncbi:MAG: transposase, partial [Deltaproteobacteria bacterium]|nr:transposase [Deltaproteobacteria bacterium]
MGSKLEPAATATLLVKAYEFRSSVGQGSDPQSVMIDAGVENINEAVLKLVEDGVLKLILAQTDICYSNSMIEAFWRVMKHQWLFLNQLDSIATLRRLVEFYVNQYNSVLPHSAFRGQTPDEMYFGTGDDVPNQLAAARAKARQAR